MIKTRLEVYAPTEEERELMSKTALEIAEKLDQLPKEQMAIMIIGKLMQATEEMTGLDWLTFYVYLKANNIKLEGK